MKDQLRFDTTDAGTITDSDKTLAGIISTDGSTLITDTLEGGKQGLDVYVINSVAATAGAEKAEDAAHTTGDTGNFILAVANHTEGALHSTDGDYAALQVDSSGRLRVVADLDFTIDSEKAEDSAHVSGDTGSHVLAVRQDTLAASVDADGDYGSFKINAVGELYTTDEGAEALLTTIDADTGAIAVDTAAMVVDLAAIEVLLTGIDVDTDAIATSTASIDADITALTKSEDAAHVSGDAGFQALAVRQDTLASSTDADGDYASLKVNADGRLYVTSDATGSDAALADTAIANTATVVGTAATDLVGTDLASRKYAMIANLGNKQIYVGGSGVTVAAGFPVSPGSVLELRAGAAIDLHAIKAAGGSANDTRILELS